MVNSPHGYGKAPFPPLNTLSDAGLSLILRIHLNTLVWSFLPRIQIRNTVYSAVESLFIPTTMHTMTARTDRRRCRVEGRIREDNHRGRLTGHSPTAQWRPPRLDTVHLADIVDDLQTLSRSDLPAIDYYTDTRNSQVSQKNRASFRIILEMLLSVKSAMVMLRVERKDRYIVQMFRLFIYSFIYSFIYLFVCLFDYLSVCLFVYLCICLFLCLFIGLFVSLFICLAI